MNICYDKSFVSEGRFNYQSMTAWRGNNAAYEIEPAGAKLRSMMRWSSTNTLAEKSRT